MLSHATRLCYLPCTMHATYMAKDKGVVGRVNWQFLPRALKSFTGHYWSGPTTIGFTQHAGKTETGPEPRLMKKQKRPQETSLFKQPLPVHLLGPSLMMLDNMFGAGPGASVGATNPGSVAQTVHRRERQI